MKKNWLILSTGFALFSMFFGSGNLVFPIAVGQESEGHYLLASLGILLTGVVVPFLGVFGMMLYDGQISKFFSCFGKAGTFWFSLFALALMGPFGVLARCLTVAHGALHLLFPNVPLSAASFGMCAVIYLLTLNKSKIVNILGTYLTPFLLVAIGIIAVFGLKNGTLLASTGAPGFDALKNGFLKGYQTMDLLAAFFFSTFILSYLKKATSHENAKCFSISIFTQSAVIGASLLSLVYIALVALGWIYVAQLSDHRPQEMIGRIAMEALGPLAAPCVCVTLVLACLTTALVLTTLFADFLRKEVAKENIGNKTALFTTLAISFCISTLEFSGIAKFIGPILEAIYPALIVLTLVNIAHKAWGFKSSHWPVTITLATKLLWL